MGQAEGGGLSSWAFIWLQKNDTEESTMRAEILVNNTTIVE